MGDEVSGKRNHQILERNVRIPAGRKLDQRLRERELVGGYVAAVDDLLRHPDGKPSIGLILCKEKDGIVAEYALRDMTKPLGIAVFTHLEKLPEEFKGTLPTIEEIEAELANAEGTEEA